MKLRSSLVLTAIMLITASMAQDRKPAIIGGVVSDARTKKPLKQAVVTVSADSFQGQRFALTDSSGNYRISNLPAGRYIISFEMEGYEKFTKENIALQEGMSLGVSFEMIRQRR